MPGAVRLGEQAKDHLGSLAQGIDAIVKTLRGIPASTFVKVS
ncbi:MAG: hypothetical protein O6929_07980 [candidate division NC10 bacterium]|nr:hypothetical protein [candidate division NC10 bacterium]